jgi:hypothetical protein
MTKQQPPSIASRWISGAQQSEEMKKIPVRPSAARRRSPRANGARREIDETCRQIGFFTIPVRCAGGGQGYIAIKGARILLRLVAGAKRSVICPGPAPRAAIARSVSRRWHRAKTAPRRPTSRVLILRSRTWLTSQPYRPEGNRYFIQLWQ